MSTFLLYSIKLQFNLSPSMSFFKVELVKTLPEKTCNTTQIFTVSIFQPIFEDY